MKKCKCIEKAPEVVVDHFWRFFAVKRTKRATVGKVYAAFKMFKRRQAPAEQRGRRAEFLNEGKYNAPINVIENKVDETTDCFNGVSMTQITFSCRI